MKFFMGMAQALFGIIFILFVGIFTMIGFGIIVIQSIIEWIREVNKDANKNIKEYYKRRLKDE